MTGGGKNERAAAVADFYSTLTPDSLSRLGDIYAPDAHFRDPFNDVTGIGAIAQIFEHMFATVEAPQFIINTCIVQHTEAMLGWDFHLMLRGREIVIHGVTHLRFDAAGLVSLHRDYWDAAEELYQHLPVVGAAMRLLRRRLSAHHNS